MYTICIPVKPHLASYMYVRYGNSIESGAIRLPSSCILYHLLHSSTCRQPSEGYRREQGNLRFVLPCPAGSKSPAIFNHLSNDSINQLEAAIDLQMHMELYEFMRNNKFKKGVMYQASVRFFQKQYQMWNITEEALLKSYQRWRDRERRERKRNG